MLIFTVPGEGSGSSAFEGWAGHWTLEQFPIATTFYNLFRNKYVDFNGDGISDLVMGDRKDPLVHISNGDGTLGDPVSYPIDFNTHWLEILDLTGDSLPDILYGISIGEVHLATQAGDGTFSDALLGTTPSNNWDSIVYNSDVYFSTYDKLYRYTTSTGTYAEHFVWTVSGFNYLHAVHDFDGDGIDDVLINDDALVGTFTANETECHTWH